MGGKKQRMQPRESQPAGTTVDELKLATREANAAVNDLLKVRRSVEALCREAVQRSVTEALTQIDHAATEKLSELTWAAERASDTTDMALDVSKATATMADNVNGQLAQVFGAPNEKALLNLLATMISAKIQPAIEKRIASQASSLANDLKGTAGLEIVDTTDGKTAIKISSLSQLFGVLDLVEEQRNGKGQPRATK